MNTPIAYRSKEIRFDTTTPPRWSAAVDRWYQLDAPAFALAEAQSQWSEESPLPAPSLVIGASAGASNESDRAFAEGPRAHRFVHTLPSVRYAAWCQVMKWAGPLLCVQDDPHTFLAALRLAMDFCPAAGEIWVLGARPIAAGARVEWLRLGHEVPGNFCLESHGGSLPLVTSDEALLRALSEGSSAALEGGSSLVAK